MMLKCLKKYRLVVIFLALVSPVQAHPHLFIEASMKVQMDDQGLAGIEHTWVFDEMFSISIIDEEDKNKDGQFDADEMESIKKNAFSNLKEYDYFTYIRSNGKPVKTGEVRAFRPSVKEGKLVYSFFLPCHIAASNYEKKIEISLFDTSYFSAVSMTDDYPQYEGPAEQFDLRGKLYRNEKFIVWEEDGFPETMIIKMRKKQ